MTDEEDDPFEQFSDAADREGDPFETLAGPDEADDEHSTADGSRTATGHETGDPDGPPTDPLADVGEEPRATGPSEDTVRADPGDVTESLDGERERDPFESPDSAFQRMDVGDVDADTVWAQLEEAQDRGSVSDAQGRTYAEVDKHTFCEHCEHFSAPPNVSCGHDGTEIIEFLDMERVRVVDCPIVAERRELERPE